MDDDQRPLSVQPEQPEQPERSSSPVEQPEHVDVDSDSDEEPVPGRHYEPL